MGRRLEGVFCGQSRVELLAMGRREGERFLHLRDGYVVLESNLRQGEPPGLGMV